MTTRFSWPSCFCDSLCRLCAPFCSHRTAHWCRRAVGSVLQVGSTSSSRKPVSSTSCLAADRHAALKSPPRSGRGTVTSWRNRSRAARRSWLREANRSRYSTASSAASNCVDETVAAALPADDSLRSDGSERSVAESRLPKLRDAEAVEARPVTARCEADTAADTADGENPRAKSSPVLALSPTASAPTGAASCHRCSFRCRREAAALSDLTRSAFTPHHWRAGVHTASRLREKFSGIATGVLIPSEADREKAAAAARAARIRSAGSGVSRHLSLREAHPE